MNEIKQKIAWYRPLVQCLQGIVVGAGGILPGLSGGVLCVIFGLYAPMMELLAHPFRTWKKHLRWIIPFGIGVVIGFFGVARVLELLFNQNGALVTCVFIGLILGTLPDLFREGGREGWSRRAIIVLCVTLALFLALFVSVQFLHVSLTMNFGWSLFCGILWGVSIIVPGMSSSSILMNVGLYEPMNAGISQFDLSILVPMGIGMVAVIFLFAKGVNLLFEKHYTIAFAVVLAAVISSTVTIIPYRFARTLDLLLSVLCIVLGAVVAYGISKGSAYLAQRAEKKEE